MIKRLFKRSTTKKRKYKKAKFFSYMTQGFLKKEFRYNFQILYCIDSAYCCDICAVYVNSSSASGGTNVAFMPAGSTGYATSGAAFTFSAAVGDYNSPIILPFNWLLGGLYAQGSAANSFAATACDYKFFKITASTVKISALNTVGAGQGYTTANPPVVIPSINQLINSYPTIFINAIDNMGVGWGANNSAGMAFNVDISQNAALPEGQPQRDRGSLRFNPKNTNDKTSVTRTFKFGSWCQPPQIVWGGASPGYFTVNSVGHWNRCQAWASQDPVATIANAQNGGIIIGTYPRNILGVPFQNSNYANGSVLFANMEVILHMSFMGETNYMTAVAP